MPSEPDDERAPTSHERAAGRPWDASYTDGPAPWDVGAPQPAVIRLAARGAFAARGPRPATVLDVGCGAGDNALHLAGLGLAVVGVDVAPAALAQARTKAAASGGSAEFLLGDALRLDRLGRRFAFGLDCGLFHTMDAGERTAYAASLAAVIEPAGRLYVLCFSDRGDALGPHPVAASALRAAFSPDRGWRVRRLRPERLVARLWPEGAPAWLAAIERR
jgi:SAM-dependent methyltransferase